MRKLFFVILVVGSVFFMTACGLNEEENITPSIDEMVVAPAATDSPSPLATTQEGTLENVPAPTPYCHGRYDEIGSFCVYIENFSTNNDYIVVRPVEWIIPEDEKRIKELGLDVERDLVSGYYTSMPQSLTLHSYTASTSCWAIATAATTHPSQSVTKYPAVSPVMPPNSFLLRQ